MEPNSHCHNADSSDARIGEALKRCAGVLDGTTDDADNAMAELFALLAEWAEDHKDTPVDALFDRMSEADRAARAGDTAQAHRLNQHVLNELDSKSALDNRERMLLARCHLRFADYHMRDRDLAAAYQSAARAVEIVRSMEWGFQLATYLGELSRFALLAGRGNEALAAAEEALNLLEDQPMHDQQRGEFFLRRAEALAALGDGAGAQLAMSEAWERFQATLSRFAGAGVWNDVADWWEVEAKRRRQMQPWQAVSEAWEQSITAHRAAVDFWQGSEPGFNFCLAEALARYSAAASEAGDDTLAESLQEESRDIRRALCG